MKVPDKEFFEKNKVHLGMLTIKDEWKRLDTFYDYSTAINNGINKYFATHTAHRLVNNEGKVLELFDSTLLEDVDHKE